MTKKLIESNSYFYPMPIVILGAVVDNKPNFLTVGFVTGISFTPPLVLAALGKGHRSNNGIREHQQFSVNMPGPDLAAVTDYVGITSGDDVDKSLLFDTFTGELKFAPMISECPFTLSCKLFREIELDHFSLFIGEVVETHADVDVLTDGVPDILKIDPMILTMPDRNYRSVGKVVGPAWSIGKDYGAKKD
jgi:flavin reductase (DIM6/NTAB) family NADH-FMN oxidoreductase RutF